jgi:dTDP-4-dehydrorhamnose 3,5-epimerase
MKLVSCLRGEVFDVAVDRRQDSPTFLQWHAERLSADNHKTLAIPEGFAHGFQTLTADCELLYLHTAAYEPDAEDGLNALDPGLAIDWPLPISDRSVRDQALPAIDPETKFAV